MRPGLFPSEAKRKAAHRIMHHRHVDPEGVLRSHREGLAERCRQQATVLLVPDSTMLDRALSLREPQVEGEKKSARRLRGFEQAGEPGLTCPDTRMTLVRDCGRDRWSRFERQARCREKAVLLVRVSRGKRCNVQVAEVDGE